MTEPANDKNAASRSGGSDEWSPARIAELAAQAGANKPAGVSDAVWRKHRAASGHMVIIRSHFKSIYLIPMVIISLFCGVTLSFGDTNVALQEAMGLLWMGAFCFYMSIFMFEWSRSWTYVMLATVAVLITLGFAINSDSIPVWYWLRDAMAHLELRFSRATFFFFSIYFGICAGVSIIKTRMNYVVVESNEILVYRNAAFGDRQRLPMLNRRVMVRIPDMLEYFHPFYNAGEIIIHAQDGEGDLVLDNVRNIRKIERAMDRLGSHLSVVNAPTVN